MYEGFHVFHEKIRQSNHGGNPGISYLSQILKYLSIDKTLRFLAEEIANYAKEATVEPEYCCVQVAH